MKAAFKRSLSYPEQGYSRVAVDEPESEEEVFASNTPSVSPNKPGRSISDSGVEKNTKHMASSDKETAEMLTESAPDKEQSDGDDENTPMPTEPRTTVITTRRRGKRSWCIKLGIIVLFLVSVGLHIHSLVSYFKENDADPTPFSPKTPERLEGVIDDSGFSGGSCLLTIDYENNTRKFDGPSEVCPTKIENPDTEKCDLDYGLNCTCAQRIKEYGHCRLSRWHCHKHCDGHFPSCKNGGKRKRCLIGLIDECNLGDDECGKCDCPAGFTGKYCHLPQKLECEKCEGKTCSSLPACSSNNTHPCQAIFNSTVMKCTKKGSGNKIDCSAKLSSTTASPHNRNQIHGTDRSKAHGTDGNKVHGTDRYTVTNSSTNTVPLTCSRGAGFVYIVCDWVVFGVIIFWFLYKIACCSICKKWDQGHRKFKKIYYPFISCVFLLIVIPPIVHCVTCCTITCDVLGKALPFAKMTLLLLVFVLLHKWEELLCSKRDQDNDIEMVHL